MAATGAILGLVSTIVGTGGSIASSILNKNNADTSDVEAELAAYRAEQEAKERKRKTTIICTVIILATIAVVYFIIKKRKK